MKRSVIAALLVFAACSTPAPPPVVATPEPPPVQEAKVIGKVRVSASALNVRATASGDGAVLEQVKKGQTLDLIESGESWSTVRLADGRIGFVSTRYVVNDAEKKPARGKGKSKCIPDSDFAFAATPMLAFSDRSAHGTVVVDAWVGVNGKVTKTKVVSNTTGDETLGFLTEREIKSAEFIAPVRNCAPRTFIYTYSREF